MNRRQKMKRMKQELEWYKKQCVPTRKVAVDSRQMRVETLRAEQMFIPRGYLYSNEQIVKDSLQRDLGRLLTNYIKWDRKFSSCSDCQVISAELKVVVPYGGDRI